LWKSILRNKTISALFFNCFSYYSTTVDLAWTAAVVAIKAVVPIICTEHRLLVQ